MRGNFQLSLIVVCCMLPNGVYGNWSSVINVALIPVSVTQTDIGNIGAAVFAVGALSSVIIARFADMFMRHMKMILKLLFIIAKGSLTWFIFLAKGIIEFKLVVSYFKWAVGKDRTNLNYIRKSMHGVSIKKIEIQIENLFTSDGFDRQNTSYPHN